MAKKILFITIVLACLLMIGCKEIPLADDSQSTPEDLKAVIKANNQFAYDLYDKYKADDGNIFFSPYSISTALAMTYEGAKGQTAEEMKKVFHFPDDNQRKNGFAAVHNDLNKKDKEYKLHTANALWAHENYAFLDEYLGTVEKYYAGRSTNMDFVNEGEKSRKTINSWVEDQTNDKIKDILPPNSINSMTRLVLTNAIYFKGQWEKEFKKSDTKDEDFNTPQGTKKVPMMRLTGKEAKFNYAENNDMQILEMDYKGKDLSMLIILPRENLDSFSLDNISQLKTDMHTQRVDIYIPRFKFETKYFMKDTLSEMGMPSAFSMTDADFSGMDRKGLLYIDFVIHQAFVEVNEEGTEAAAATAVGMQMMSAMPSQPKIFRADHPFIFMIQDKDNENILFMGRVNNPSED